MVLGLASRSSEIELHPFLSAYLGDVFWALLVYWLSRFILKKQSLILSVIVALSFSYLIEISQLYQADWANELRQYKLIALVFGYGFLWSDILCYTVGIATGFILDTFLIRKVVESEDLTDSV